MSVPFTPLDARMLAALEHDVSWCDDFGEATIRETARRTAAICASVAEAENQELRALLTELVSVFDGEVNDLSTCDYYMGERTKQCSFGCTDEPECQTCCPRGGWPLVRARAVLAKYEKAADK